MKVVEKNVDYRQYWKMVLPPTMVYGTFKIVSKYYTKKGNLFCVKTIITFIEKN